MENPLQVVVVRAKKNGTWEKNRRKLKEKQQKTGGDFIVRTCPYEFQDHYSSNRHEAKGQLRRDSFNKAANSFVQTKESIVINSNIHLCEVKSNYVIDLLQLCFVANHCVPMGGCLLIVGWFIKKKTCGKHTLHSGC